MNYIVYPISLRFIPNHLRHTLSTVSSFKEEHDLKFNVKACLGETLEEALQATKDCVLNEVVSHWLANNLDLQVKDFELIYSAEEIVNNRVWIGGGVVSVTKL